MDYDLVKEKIARIPNWFFKMELAEGIVSPGIQTPAERLELFGIPEDLTGKKVLDIGPMEGYYSFVCEDRGADVTAYDITLKPGLMLAAELRNSKINIVKGNVYQLDAATIGRFDLVLFMGVLYHLRHPLLALDRIFPLVDDLLIVESQVCDRWFIDNQNKRTTLNSFNEELERLPMAQFYPGSELNNDSTNWWSPNEAGLLAMLQSSGYHARFHAREYARAVFHCRCGVRPDHHEFHVS